MKKRIVLLLVLSMVLTSFGGIVISAASEGEGTPSAEEIINQLRSQVSTLTQDKETLTNQLNIADAQNEMLVNENASLSAKVAENDLWLHPINREDVMGNWQTVGFVSNISDFDYSTENASLFLKSMNFAESTVQLSSTDGAPIILTWIDNVVIHDGDKTAERFLIKNYQGQKYMFYEWKSGDYTIRGEKPSYYVLKKGTNTNGGTTPNPNAVNINFNSQIAANDIRINSWTAERIGSNIRLTLNYDNGILRSYSTFNPPDGAVFMYFQQNQFLVGTGNTLSVDIPVTNLSGINDITMKFWSDGEQDNNFIFFQTDQIASLLN